MCDGSSCGNPGPSKIGVVVWQRENGQSSARKMTPSHTISENIGIGTNNDAEWKAVIAALRYANMLGYIESKGEVFLYSDSLLVVNQCNGIYKVRDTKMLGYYTEFCKYRQQLKLTVTWIPRQLTCLADQLT